MSDTMTPPMSPIILDLEELQDEQAINMAEHDVIHRSISDVGFICAGETRGEKLSFHADSCLKSGSLQRLFNENKDNCPLWSPTVIELFGYQFVTQIALQENMEQLFMCAKMCINSIQSGTTGSLFVQQGKNTQIYEERKNLIFFLQYVNMFSKRYLPDDDKLRSEFLTRLCENLHALLLYMGSISGLPTSTILNIALSGYKSSNPFSQQYHTYLDVYWSMIQIIFTVLKHSPAFCYRKNLVVKDDNEGELMLLDEVIEIILSDLVNLSVYRKDKNSEYRSADITPFSCSCCMELWVMLIHTVQNLHIELNKEPFMVRIHRILQKFGKEKSTPVDEEIAIDSTVFYNCIETPKNTSTFSMWLTFHVARLYSVDINGNIKKIEKIHNNYFIVESILKKTLAQENLGENELRCQIRLCLSVCHLWQPTTSLIVILWDYFFRRLNSNFHLPSSGITGLATISLTPLSLLENCRKCEMGAEVGMEKESSFGLFLRILSNNLSRFVGTGSMQEWRQIKGRFYSKFHQRRLQELSDTGLDNFTHLFITLAITVELEDVAGKLIDFYNMLGFITLSTSKRRAILVGSLALVHIYIDKGMDASFFTDRVVTYFNILCRELEEVGDPQKHYDIWMLLSLYLDSFQDILESSPTLSCSEYKLLGPGLSNVWGVLGENELRHSLGVMVSVITRLRNVISSNQENMNLHILQHHEELALKLWQMVYPFVKEHACTQTPPPILADLAAAFTLLSNNIPPSIISHDKFVNHVKYFGLSENVHVSISCRYLSQVLSETGALESMLLICPQTTLIQAWFRCVILTPPSSPQLHVITRVILQLSEVRKLFTDMHKLISQPIEVAPKVFIKSLGELYKNAESLKEKMLLREKVMSYFSLVPQHVSPVLKIMGPGDILQIMFTTVGYLLKHCSPLLFHQSNPSPLPAIISVMVTPHFLFNTDKQVNSAFLVVIKESLHMYIQGLSKLDFRRAPYVERRLKDIVSIYLQKFPIKSSSTLSESSAIHPLVSCLSESYTKSPSPSPLNFRHFILEIVHEKYLKLKNLTVPASANVGLSYVTEVLQRTSSGEVIARDNKVLLLTILEYILFSTSSPMKQHASKIMQFLLEACYKNPAFFPSGELECIIKRFIDLYSRMHFDGVFDVLESIGILYTAIIINIIPHCTALVLDLEMKRGVGVDSKVRKTYYSLLTSVGEVGLIEIQRLQTA